ncbi:MAG: succinate dehydrogenase, cytochrome b556 subunit [Alphaproteobacteria bacterium]|nr:succinate dehydrogenase, cytochrome b556 subunit [Alphaproteobacteria bacterium]
MADTGQIDRPLSPHIAIYRKQLTSVISIFHRLTGIGLAATAILIVWWFLAAATSPAYFDFIDGLMTSWLGLLVLLVSLWAFWFHFFNGIRHLRWDSGKGLSMEESTRSGWRIVIFSVVFTTASIYLVI